MHTVKEKVYAKINLTLEVRGEHSGYHELDSLVASISLFDTVTVKKRKDKLVTLKMQGIDLYDLPVEKNNAYKAAIAFIDKYESLGADITIVKNIPVGAGLGGSSADAAGVLNALAKLYGVEDEEGLDCLADKLGSDTKYMRRGGYARMQGRGEKLSFFDCEKELWFLLFCPKASVSTAECFKGFDLLPKEAQAENVGKTEACIEGLLSMDEAAVGQSLANDLYKAASTLNEEVEKTLNEARSFSPLGAVMTGSGSGVLALFETKELCEWAKSRYRGNAETVVVKTVVK